MNRGSGSQRFAGAPRDIFGWQPFQTISAVE
jgi:hypothetical protein